MNKIISVIFYLFSILVANLLVIKFGVISFLGLSFPAGAVLIGLSFSARDYVQKYYGKNKCWIWMIVASVITGLLNVNLAFASVSAFIIAEFVDWLFFTYSNLSFRKRIIVSNVFSTPIDSIVFVTIAFGFSWSVIFGQSVVKLLSSFLVLFLRKRK